MLFFVLNARSSKLNSSSFKMSNLPTLISKHAKLCTHFRNFLLLFPDISFFSEIIRSSAFKNTFFLNIPSFLSLCKHRTLQECSLLKRRVVVISYLSDGRNTPGYFKANFGVGGGGLGAFCAAHLLPDRR